jgi:S-adenosylmethionine hydrolase
VAASADPPAASPWVTFLSDYGLDDSCVGVCHGVLARRAPSVRILDICHLVTPQDVEYGATMLAGAVPYLPVAVHLALVDPPASSKRARGVAVRTGDGATFLAPDNGLTSRAWAAAGGVRAAHELANRELWLASPSRTFRGRDIFVPVAAHLATGGALTDVGPAVDPATLVRLPERRSHVHGDHVHGEVVAIDHFGNLALNVVRGDLEAVGIALGDRVEVRMAGRTMEIPFTVTFAEVEPGRASVCEDSYRRIMIAVNLGHAGSRLRAARGDALVLGRVTRSRAAAG